MKDLMKYTKEEGTNPKDKIGSTKPPMTLVPMSALVVVAEAMKDGAGKYDPYNWRDKTVTLSAYLDAAIRHLAAYYDGEECARDSEIHHLAHAIAGLMILLDAGINGKCKDDRPPAGAAADLIDRFTRKKDERD